MWYNFKFFDLLYKCFCNAGLTATFETFNRNVFYIAGLTARFENFSRNISCIAGL